MIYVLGGGGNAGLNFKVVGGATEPTNPTENTIWVNTDTTITSWVFASEQPESPTEGMVWFTTSVSSSADITIFKNDANNITIYPVSCRQYVGGTWVSKIVQTYQDAWVDWHLKLYSSGNEYALITGGWTSTNLWTNTTNSTLGVSFTKNSENFTIVGLGHYNGGAVYTVNKIDLAPYKKLVVKGTSKVSEAYDQTLRICVWADTIGKDNATAYVALNNVNGTVDTYLDISELNIEGGYYVGIIVKGGGGDTTITLTMTDCYLE